MHAPADSPRTSFGTAPRLALWVAIYGLAGFVALRPILDYDIWFHLRVGQWIVENGTVPSVDTFSSHGIATNQPSIAHSWLFEVGIYGLFQWLGLTGLVVYRLVLGLLVIAAIHRLAAKRAPQYAVATGLTALTVIAFFPIFTERPWLFTILFTTLTLDVVLDLRNGRRSKMMWLLPLVYVVWSNIHIQFVYGLFILGLACVAPALDRWLRLVFPSASASGGEGLGVRGVGGAKPLAALTAACFAATLVNPYHVHLYLALFEFSSSTGGYRYIMELQALEFREVYDWAILCIFVLAVFALGRRSKWSSFELLLLAASAYLSFRAKRDCWFVVLTSVAVISTTDLLPAVRDRLIPTRRQLLAVIAAVFIVVIGAARLRGFSETQLEEAEARQFPKAAADYVAGRAEELRRYGGLYNHFNWGHYLIWRLPELPVAMDGRLGIHGDARVHLSMNVWDGRRDWIDDPDLFHASVVIADAKSPLTQLLRHDRRSPFVEVAPEVHGDKVAAVFVRRFPLAIARPAR